MKKIIPSLNGLRAMSILLVVYSHLLTHFHNKNNPGAQMGVNVFFIISGYLITLLLVNEEQINRTINLRKFYIRRTIRIFPAYYFLLVIYFLLQCVHVLYFSKVSWFSSLTYTKYLFPRTDTETGHFWSLSIEEHFYLVWPIIFKYAKKLRVIFAFAVIGSVTLVRLLTEVGDMHLFTRADALMLGCVFALYNSKLIVFLKNVLTRYSFVAFIPFLVLISCMVIKWLLHLNESSLHFTRAFFGSFGLISEISICFIILVSIYSTDNLWYRFLNSKLMDYIGRLSYSIYLWQQLFISDRIPYFSKFPYNIFFIALASILSFYLIEKPFLKLKDRFATRPNLFPVSRKILLSNFVRRGT